jgi:hypothetical protein
MKKILAVLLATSSIAAFAETFQDFNNNAYLQYNNTSINLGQGNADGYTLGTTIQAKNNIWINAEAYGSAYNSNNWGVVNAGGAAAPLGGSTYDQFLATALVMILAASKLSLMRLTLTVHHLVQLHNTMVLV